MLNLTHAQKIALCDAADACLRLLAERRTKGRMELYLAVKDLRWMLIPPPPYTVRKQLRDATKASYAS